MKTLVTKRLILRGLTPDDLEAFHAYAKKPHIGPMAGWAPHESYAKTYDILKLMIKEDETWAITLKPVDQMIGTITLHARTFDNAINNQKELGYVIDEPYWGLGLMTEAVCAVLAYAFNTLELDKVLCGHAETNFGSKRVIEKTGFRYTHQEEREHYDHTKINILMYELTKKTYKELSHDNTQNKI